MLSFTALVIGLLTGCFFAALVGVIGSHRRIGFGWAFLISVIVSPIIGLIVTLCTPKLPNRDRKWGCFSALVGLLVIALILVLVYIFMPEFYEQVRTWIESLK